MTDQDTLADIADAIERVESDLGMLRTQVDDTAAQLGEVLDLLTARFAHLDDDES